jgi:predicted glycosyltransferase
VPRLEQYIRASRAQQIGLVSMLADDGVRDPRAMAEALRALPHQRPPSQVIVPGLLDGLENVDRLAKRWLSARSGWPGSWNVQELRGQRA